MSMSCHEVSNLNEHTKSTQIVADGVSPKCKRPELSLLIYNKPFNALLDSGASVSAISEEIFASIKRSIPEGQQLSILPVTGVTISTAVKGRSRKVTTQVLIPFSIFGHTTDCICLVVPHLATSMILGDDWLTQNKVCLDYSERIIRLTSWNLNIPFSKSPEDGINRMSALFTVSISPQDCARSIPEHCIASVEMISQQLQASTNNNMITSLQVTPEDDLEPFDQVTEHLSSIQNLSSNQFEQVVDLFHEYHHIFRTRPGLNLLFTCRFNVSEDIPFKIRPYPVPFARRPAVEKELARMLEWGVIERCSSPYSNPIICVGKADGSVRICLDARRVNKIILPMRDSSPPLDELLARFGGKTIFSSIDFTAGYWQVSLHRDVRKYTAFVYDGRTYQFCVVPFGLNISNTAFQQALESVLSNPVENYNEDGLGDLHIYVDDVLVSSTTFEDHLRRLRLLFKKIAVSGMSLKLSKCKFLRDKIKFLGHIITPSGMSMDPSKLSAIHDFPVPRHKKDLQSFIGFCNFYRKFTDHHASLIGPLIALLKKGTPWRFNEEDVANFNSVKSAFTARFLAHPDFTSEFYVQTDASHLGLGVELFQVDVSNERQTIGFASRTLNSAEKNYSATELELLSIVFACEKFRVFILGYPVNVLTDHKALTFLFRCRLRNARLTRWTLVLQEFDLRIRYITGPSNVIDALSRNPVGRDRINNQSDSLGIFIVTPRRLLLEYQSRIESFHHILREQQMDPALRKVVDLLSNQSPVLSAIAERYCMYRDILFYRRHPDSDRWLVCVPLHRVDELISKFHLHFGHVGPKKCIAAIREACYFRGLSGNVRRVVKSCDTCQRAKFSTVRTEGEMQHVQANAPLQRVCVDLYGPLPSGWNHVKYVFVVLDCFSRFVRLFPIKRSTAVVVTNRMITDYIEIHGTPQTVVSDHGVQFVSNVWRARLTALGVSVTTTSVYHPQSNPAERVMRELGRLFRTYCHQSHTEWPRYVQYIEWVLNNTVHESTGFTPSEIFLRTERYSPIYEAVECPPKGSDDFTIKLTMAAEVQRTKAEERRIRHDRRGKATIFLIGEEVLVRAHRSSSAVDHQIKKFFMLYEGPYKIVEIKSCNAYVVADPVTDQIRGTFNIIFLRKYIRPTNAKPSA